MKFSLSFLKSRPHFWALALILLLAIGLRGFHIGGLPMGLHGDEGIVGYEAERILRDGSIGPYSRASWGQPTGPIYFSAVAVAIGGREIEAVRAWSAIVGVLTVLALWAVTRAFLGEATALISAFLLATLTWHIHYARIAFPLESWPLICLLVVAALCQATRARQSRPARWWLIAGFLNGLGVYAYKAHPLFGALATVGALWILARDKAPWLRRLSWFGLFIGSAIVAANFLIRYALNPDNGYGEQFDLASTFNQPAWQALHSHGAQALYLVGRYFNWWNKMVLHPQPDYVDASGLVPLISPVLAALALLGFVAWKRREPLVQWARWVIIVMPLADVVTFDGFARRTFPIAPFLCVLGAVGAVEMVRWSRRFAVERGARARPVRRLMPGIVGTLIAAHAALSWHAYFISFAQMPLQAWVFCDELTKSLAYMRSLPPDRPIYFYSSRWSITYDTRKFLAPDLNARDASAEFSPDKRLLWPPPPQSHAVWVLLDSYKARATELQMLYPNARLLAGAPSISAEGQPAFLVLEN